MEKRNIKTREILEWVICILIAVVAAIFVKYYIGTSTIIKQTSMYPTLKQNERLILNRMCRGKTPERGDIITFEAPNKKARTINDIDTNNPIAIYDNEDKNIFNNFIYHVLEIGKTSYIKRIIGLPNDHIVIKDGNVYVNDQLLEEPYLQENIRTSATNFHDIIVPDDYVFAVGDNRNESIDCREFGCIPIKKIEGKVVIRFWPLSRFGEI